MNRNERRAQSIETKIYSKAINKLTPLQTQLIEKLAMQKANEMVEDIASIINNCYYKAMRKNRVGECRANKILAETEKLIDLEGGK